MREMASGEPSEPVREVREGSASNSRRVHVVGVLLSRVASLRPRPIDGEQQQGSPARARPPLYRVARGPRLKARRAHPIWATSTQIRRDPFSASLDGVSAGAAKARNSG